MLCKYRDVLGKPNEGIHSIRVFDIAIMDLAFTVLAAAVITLLFKWPFLPVLAVVLVIGIFMHRLFCVNTTVNKMIFGVV